VEEVDVRSGTLLVLTVAGAVFWICGGEPPVLRDFWIALSYVAVKETKNG
jgi:hypothetical protein